MQIICPECHTLYESKKPITNNRLTCKNCKTIFLTPIEAFVEAEETDGDLGKAKSRLKNKFREEKRRFADQLEEEFKKEREKLEERHKKAEEERRKAKEAADKKTVKNPIAKMLLKIVLSIYFVVILIVTMSLMVYQYYNAKNHITVDLKASERVFGKGLSEAVWNMDTSGMQSIITGMLEHPVIIGVKIVDESGEVIGGGGYIVDNDGKQIFYEGNISDEQPDKPEPASVSRHQKEDDRVSGMFWHTFPLSFTESGEKSDVGKVTVYSRSKFIFQRVKGGYSILIINALVVAIALWITFLWVSRIFLARPLTVLTNAVAELNLQNLDSLEVNVNASGRNEIKILEESFNSMVNNLIEEKKRIIQLSKTFEKFVPKQFLSRIAGEGISSIKLGGMESEHLAILFITIHSFEALSEYMDSEKMFKFLNSYLSRMEAPIENHGGFIYELSKNAITAVFDLNDRSMEALSAIYAAIDMQKALNLFNEEQEKLGYPSITIGAGIHSGKVTLGTLGNENRLESTVIGEATEIAMRLQMLTDTYNSQILISSDTFDLLKSYDAFQWREIDTLQLEGKEDPIRFYEVFDADPVIEIKQQILELYNDGLKHICDQDWDDAIKCFEKCLDIYPVDVVSQKYIKRCQSRKEDSFGFGGFLKNESEAFKPLSDSSISDIAKLFKTLHFDKDVAILRYGEVGSAFHVVYEGTLNVFLSDKPDQEIKVATLKRGDCFGEMSLMTGEPIMATIKSATSVELLTLGPDQFETLLRDHPSLNSYFHKLFLRRLVKNKAEQNDSI